MTAIDSFSPALGRYVTDFVTADRRLRALCAALHALAFVLAWMLACCIADRFGAFSPVVRFVLLAVGAAALVLILLNPLVRLFSRRIDWVAASEELEQRNPSLGQRLVTLISQWLMPADHRGSPQLLGALSDQLSSELDRSRAARLVRWTPVIKPAALLLLIVGLWAGLWPAQWLNLPRLAQRHLAPWAKLPPVTLTGLELLSPVDVEVPERGAVTVKARIIHMSDGPAPTLCASVDGVEWSRMPMVFAGDNLYTGALTDLEKDTQFEIEAGDARSPRGIVRVLRRPQIAEFRIRYSYPAYTGRPALSIQNTDGLVEAPRGTEATLSVVATEPLSRAVMKVGGVSLEMAPGAEPNIRQAPLAIARDQVYEVEFTSDRGVSGKSVRPMSIRAVPDRPPLVRVLAPATDLRLAPRDIVNVSWQAIDDYGVVQAVLSVQINSMTPVEHVLEGGSDPRRKEGNFELDLATLGLKIGDVITLSLHGTDTAGQKSADLPRHILISPRSIDATTHRRISELAEAARQAKQWATQLSQVRQQIEDARKLPPARSLEVSVAMGRVSRDISGSQETALVARQSILRAIASNASPPLADALSYLLDTLVQQADGVARVDQALGWGQTIEDSAASRLARSAAAANELATALKVLWEGEQASAVQADLANLRESPPPAVRPSAPRTSATRPMVASRPLTRPATRDGRKQMMERAQQEIAALLAEMGIKASSSSVQQQVQDRIETAKRYAANAPRADFVSAARRWRDAIVNGAAHLPRFDDRLYAGSQAMALRADAELVGARDLNLSARAASALVDRFTAFPAEGTTPEQSRAEKTRILDQYVEAFAALKAEHEVNVRAMRALPSEARQIHDQSRIVHAKASEARVKMIEWASGPEATADVIAARVRELEELAMNANAATATRDFDKAQELDRRLAATLKKPEVAEASRAPRAIDSITEKQEAAQQARESDPAAAAQAQEQVAGQLASLPGAEPADSSADTRQAATAAISAAQEKLASLPMQLAGAQQAAGGAAEQTRRLESARAELKNAAPDQKEMALRAVRQANEDADAARREFEAAMAPISPASADELAQALRPFAPESLLAVSAAQERLRPALDELRKVLESHSTTGDRGGIEPAMQAVRTAIQQTQDALRQAQSQIVERDPLVAARWFARAAADALASSSPDRTLAARHQQRTLESLQFAATDALRRSRNTRLAEVPSFAPFYASSGGWGDLDPRVAGERLFHSIPSLREWGRLRQRLGDPLSAPMRESEPAGFADSLRLYFEVLSKEESRTMEKKDRGR